MPATLTSVWEDYKYLPMTHLHIRRTLFHPSCIYIFHSSLSFRSSYNSHSCYHQWCEWCGWLMAMWLHELKRGKGHRWGVHCIECDGPAAEVSWLDFDFVQLMLFIWWLLSLLNKTNAFSFFKDFWNVSEQLPDAEIWDRYQLLMVWYNEDGDLERVLTWRRLSTADQVALNLLFHIIICAVWIIYKGSGNGLSVITPKYFNSGLPCIRRYPIGN